MPNFNYSANGMQCTRKDNIQLQAMQKLQMEEKEYIQKVEEKLESTWHQVLINDVRSKVS